MEGTFSASAGCLPSFCTYFQHVSRVRHDHDRASRVIRERVRSLLRPPPPPRMQGRCPGVPASARLGLESLSDTLRNFKNERSACVLKMPSLSCFRRLSR